MVAAEMGLRASPPSMMTNRPQVIGAPVNLVHLSELQQFPASWGELHTAFMTLRTTASGSAS